MKVDNDMSRKFVFVNFEVWDVKAVDEINKVAFNGKRNIGLCPEGPERQTELKRRYQQKMGYKTNPSSPQICSPQSFKIEKLVYFF